MTPPDSLPVSERQLSNGVPCMIRASVCAASRGVGIRRCAPDPSNGARVASGVVCTGQSLCSYVYSRTQPLIVVLSRRRSTTLNRDGTRARMATTSAARSTPPPEYRPDACPKPESAPSEKTRSLKHLGVKAKEAQAMPTNAAMVLRNRVVPRAALAPLEAAPVADSTGVVQAEQEDYGWMGPKKFRVCPVCSRRYSSMEWLRRHVLMHERGKPLKCTQCDHWYMVLRALALHMSRVHQA
nr:zinc finger protein 581-like [Rhipicephalus microplus]